jgi:hypothetical protein
MVLRCRTESRHFFFTFYYYIPIQKNTSDTNFPFPLVGIHLSLVISIRTVAICYIFNITSQREDNDHKKGGEYEITDFSIKRKPFFLLLLCVHAKNTKQQP